MKHTSFTPTACTSSKLHQSFISSQCYKFKLPTCDSDWQWKGDVSTWIINGLLYWSLKGRMQQEPSTLTAAACDIHQHTPRSASHPHFMSHYSLAVPLKFSVVILVMCSTNIYINVSSDALLWPGDFYSGSFTNFYYVLILVLLPVFAKKVEWWSEELSGG